MAGARKPTALVIATGAKHLTKAETAERLAREVQPCTDDLAPPAFLTCAEKKRFVKLAGQLAKIKIMGETDVETLARYVAAQTLYERAVKELRAAEKIKPEGDDQERQLESLVVKAALLDKLDKRVDRYFKQATAAATALGLTISARCKLVLPKGAEDEKPKQNKFARFNQGAG